jgi:steroid delta-isomerase-like uncharacterized protein
MGTGSDLWNQFVTLSSKQDWAGVRSLFATDAVHVDPTGRREGCETIVAYFEGHTAFSDVSLETSLVIEQGDTVVAEWAYRATHTGPLALADGSVIPATGKSEDLPCVTISEIRDGKFVAMREYFDLMTAMSQLGLLPTT